MNWSKSWKSSKERSKQRKYRMNAPLHVRRKFVSAHLSKELREKYKIRAVPLRKGDMVEVMRGEFKGRSGKVVRVSLKKMVVFVDGVKRKNMKGDEVFVPLSPSNLMIKELNLDDVKRLKKKRGNA